VGRAFNSAACFSTAAAFAGSVLIVTPPVAVCANAADAIPKDIKMIRESFFTVDSQVVRGVSLTRVDGWRMTARGVRTEGQELGPFDLTLAARRRGRRFGDGHAATAMPQQ
jgi:hypothetical protein